MQNFQKATFVGDVIIAMVSPRTSRVETFFEELEYLEPRLKALGVTLADEEVDHV